MKFQMKNNIDYNNYNNCNPASNKILKTLLNFNCFKYCDLNRIFAEEKFHSFLIAKKMKVKSKPIESHRTTLSFIFKIYRFD